MGRFVLVYGKNASVEHPFLRKKTAVANPWQFKTLSPQCYLFYQHGDILSNEKDVFLLGQLFQKNGCRVQEILETLGQDIILSAGKIMVEEYWGSYIAILYNKIEDCITILRDPAGGMPCFYMHFREKVIIFSYLEDLYLFFDIHLSLESHFLKSALRYHRLYTEATGIQNTKQLLSGQALVLKRGELKTTLYWEPTQFASKKFKDSHPEETLRKTLFSTLSAQARAYSKIMLYLSGGFDSTLIASVLKHTAPQTQIIGFHYAIKGSRASEEEKFAKEAAEFLNIPIHCVILDPLEDDVLQENDYTLLPCPSPQYIGHILWRKAQQTAQAYNCDVIWDGDGGDQLFYAFQTSRIVNDSLFFGFRNFFQRMKEASLLCQNAYLPLLRDVWKNFRACGVQHIYQEILESPKPFLRPFDGDIDSLIPAVLKNRKFPQGKVKQIAGLLNLQLNRVPLKDASIPSLHPLQNQPLMELCLSMPSFLLAKNGISRGLVRSAMKEIMPESIRTRQTKGGTLQFVNLWFQKQSFQNYLLNGELVQHNLVNKDVLKNCFSSSKCIYMKAGILDLLPLEIWMRQIKSLKGITQ